MCSLPAPAMVLTTRGSFPFISRLVKQVDIFHVFEQILIYAISREKKVLKGKDFLAQRQS